MENNNPVTGGLREIIDELANRHTYDWEGFKEAGCTFCGPLKNWLPKQLLCSDGSVYDLEKIEVEEIFVPNNQLEKVGGSIEDMLFTAKYSKKISPRVLSEECLDYLETTPKYRYPKEEVFKELELARQENKLPEYRRNLFSRIRSAYRVLFNKTNLKELRKTTTLKILGHFRNAFELGYFPNEYSLEQRKYTNILSLLCYFNHPENKDYVKSVARAFANSLKSREKDEQTILVAPKKSKDGYEVRMTYEAELELFSGDSDETLKKIPPYGRIEKEVWLKFIDELITGVEKRK